MNNNKERIKVGSAEETGVFSLKKFLLNNIASWNSMLTRISQSLSQSDDEYNVKFHVIGELLEFLGWQVFDPLKVNLAIGEKNIFMLRLKPDSSDTCDIQYIPVNKAEWVLEEKATEGKLCTICTNGRKWRITTELLGDKQEYIIWDITAATRVDMFVLSHLRYSFNVNDLRNGICVAHFMNALFDMRELIEVGNELQLFDCLRALFRNNHTILTLCEKYDPAVLMFCMGSKSPF